MDDLLCDEDKSFVNNDSFEFVHFDPDIVSDDEPEFVAFLLRHEGEFSPDGSLIRRLREKRGEADYRRYFVDWIIKNRENIGYRQSTAYLAVNYMDRFLAKHASCQKVWQIQLLSVACLILAAKIEEIHVNFDPQIRFENYKFQRKDINKMELFVCASLGWRFHSITPFHFMNSFVRKIDSNGVFHGDLINRTSSLVLDTCRVCEFLAFQPSIVAAAAALSAADAIPELPAISHDELFTCWTDLNKETIRDCYILIQKTLLGDNNNGLRSKKTIIPQSPVTVLESNPQSSDFPILTTESSPNKRRRLE